MQNHTLKGRKSPSRFAERFSSKASPTDQTTRQEATCPVCDAPIDAVESDPRRTAAPCGHALRDYSLQTMTTSNDDAHRLVTDGGTETVLAPAARKSPPSTYHHDAECHYLQRAESVVERSLAALPPGCDPCSVCVDEVIADGGAVETEHATVVFLTYEDDADLKYDDEGQITNHDELVDAGQTYREVRVLERQIVAEFDMEVVDEGHPLWCDEIASLEPGDALRVDELRGESDD